LFYAWDVTVPAGTEDSAPIEQTLKLTKGTVTKVSIKFPAGCSGLVKVRVFHEEFQLVPLTKGEYVTGDDETVDAEMLYELGSRPYALKLRASSPGCQYDHTITVRVTLMPTAYAAAWLYLAKFVDAVTTLIGLKKPEEEKPIRG
jgi:hypothetical protein